MSLIAAGAPIEIMCLERVRIELDGPLEFCTITNVSRSTPVLPLPSLCRILNKMCGDRVTTLVDEPRIVVEVDLPFRSEPQLLLWRCELGDKGVRPSWRNQVFLDPTKRVTIPALSAIPPAHSGRVRCCCIFASTSPNFKTVSSC